MTSPFIFSWHAVRLRNQLEATNLFCRYPGHQFPGKVSCSDYYWMQLCNYRPQTKFLRLFVILFTGGGLTQYMLEYHPRRSRHPPTTRHPPRTRHPPKSRHPPLGADTPREQSMRAVSILLECYTWIQSCYNRIWNSSIHTISCSLECIYYQLDKLTNQTIRQFKS